MGPRPERLELLPGGAPLECQRHRYCGDRIGGNRLGADVIETPDGDAVHAQGELYPLRGEGIIVWVYYRERHVHRRLPHWTGLPKLKRHPVDADDGILIYPETERSTACQKQDPRCSPP